MKSTAFSRARASGARAGLSRESVIAAAAEIADREGLDALTLASLATKQGVGLHPYSTRGWNAGAQTRIARPGAPRAGRSAWRRSDWKVRRRRVHALADAYRNFIHNHPGIYALTLKATGKGVAASDAVGERIVVICASVLGGYSLGKRETIHAIRAMRSPVHGFATLEAGGGFEMPVPIDASFAWMVEALIAGVERITP